MGSHRRERDVPELDSIGSQLGDEQARSIVSKRAAVTPDIDDADGSPPVRGIRGGIATVIVPFPRAGNPRVHSCTRNELMS
jgi:hypothetical protein